MFKAERLQKIKNLVYDRKQVDVSALSQLMNVTQVTVRSDLEQLEAEGFLKRLHGGAVLNEDYNIQQEINALLSGQVIAYDENREGIAKKAASLIKEGDCIFLGPGETCYYIARELLPRKKLTVLTNNLYVANVLSPNMYINLAITGGQIMQGRFCVSGEMFHRTIEHLYLSKAFFSVSGADTLAGYTLDTNQEVLLYREIEGRTQQMVLVMDHRKFDTISFVRLGNLDMCKTVITTPSIPPAYIDYYRQMGVDLLLAGEEGS